MPVIPLYFYSFTIATTKDLKYTPRLDQFTLAQGAHRAK
jgi:hypothetical protein